MEPLRRNPDHQTMAVADVKTNSILFNMPTEIIFNIFEYLNFRSIKATYLIGKKFAFNQNFENKVYEFFAKKINIQLKSNEKRTEYFKFIDKIDNELDRLSQNTFSCRTHLKLALEHIEENNLEYFEAYPLLISVAEARNKILLFGGLSFAIQQDFPFKAKLLTQEVIIREEIKSGKKIVFTHEIHQEYLQIANSLSAWCMENQGLKTLHSPSLENFGLTQLPEEITYLENLDELHLYNNELITLPPCISKLSFLKIINLSLNPIEELPSTLLDLPNLQKIILDSKIAIPFQESELGKKLTAKGVKIVQGDG